jgi:AraC-like DNA-binding protein
MKSGKPKRTELNLEHWLMALAGRQPRIEPNLEVSRLSKVLLKWHIAPRVLSDHLVYFPIDGSGEGIIGGERVRFNSGDLLWVPAGIAHEFWTHANSPSITLYHIRFRLYERGPQGLRYKLLHNAWELRPYMEQIVDEIQTPGPHSLQHLRALITLLFSSLLRMGAQVSGERVLSNSQRQAVAQYVRNHLTERPTPAGLAVELRLSHDYLTRIFRRTFGVAPRTWFMRERIRLASMALAESPLSVKEIAYQHGYDDVYLFSRQFKQVIGVSPRAFRKRHG